MRKLDLKLPHPPFSIELLIFYPGDGHWGELEPLRETEWARGVTEITGTSLSHALHGMAGPLLKELPIDPRLRPKKISPEQGECLSSDHCPSFNKGLCRPGGRFKREWGPPSCYGPPLEDGTPWKIREVFQQVALAWSEGRHVVLVQGEEFSLR